MHLFQNPAKFDGHKIVTTTRLVTVDEGKEWHPENYIDVVVPHTATFDVDKKVGRSAIVRAVNAALDELRK